MKNFWILPASIILSCSMLAKAQTAPSSSTGTPQGNADTGKKLFVEHGCWTCHGYAAQGGQLNPNPTGPRLAGRVLPWVAFSKYVRQPGGDMIPYTEKVLSDQQLADIYAWLKSIPAPPSAASIPILKD